VSLTAATLLAVTQGPPPGAGTLSRVRGVTLRVVALSLVLVTILEALQVTAAAVSGDLEAAGPFLVDLAKKVPWSVLVCTGVWLGLELGRGRVLVAAAAGLVAAPIASLLLRAFAEGAHAMAFAEAPEGPSSLLVAAVRGVEYACLVVLAAWLGRRARPRVQYHAAAGLAVAVPFGLVLLALSAASAAAPLDTGPVLAWAVNELLFPVGCALILYRAAMAERQGVALAAAS
jgi:hypothetical protein